MSTDPRPAAVAAEASVSWWLAVVFWLLGWIGLGWFGAVHELVRWCLMRLEWL